MSTNAQTTRPRTDIGIERAGGIIEITKRKIETQMREERGICKEITTGEKGIRQGNKIMSANREEHHQWCRRFDFVPLR